MNSRNGARNAHSGGAFFPKQKNTPPPETIRTEELQVERKTFVFQLQENVRGRFLRITEGAHGRRNAIVIPAPGLADFARALKGLLEEADQQPGLSPDDNPPAQ